MPRISERQSRCSGCSLRDLCVPTGLAESEMRRVDHIMSRRRIARGDVLYRMGDKFTNLYAIRLGHFKTHQLSSDGVEQITGFQMAGELLGMDAIGTDRHNCYAVALEDSEVCEIPFDRLEGLFAEIPTLLRHFHRTMSQEITRDQTTMLLLGNMHAEQRIASFLINLSARYKMRGYSSTNFQLRMSREDIGKYLGLTIESVSRLLSKFKKMEWITVDKREIGINDLAQLKQLAMQPVSKH
ncbi:fumarate/nitrate reduction transcriptional regulator Fnr [Solimicrobium silvestre]|nr:fumarate/nitrate reduction transcriptional regulator Fnr [Solimicrobium silvestre]